MSKPPSNGRLGRVLVGSVTPVVGGALLVCAGIAVNATRSFPDRAPDISDARACPHSNVVLDEVAAHFGLVVPPKATEVRYDSDVHPLFGEYSLTLDFTTTPSGLATFLAKSHLSEPEPANESDPLPVVPGCIEQRSGQHRFVVAGDPESSATPRAGGDLRTATIDLGDPAHPRVVVHAFDL
jgi:hypothetical protein